MLYATKNNLDSIL